MSDEKKKPGERKERFTTLSGIEVDRVYQAEDTGQERDLSNPGEYPYTRGIQPAMYRSRLWTMRQYAGYATAEESNRRYRYLLSQGQTGLSVAFDLPTQIGYDADDPIAEGEVGRVGVSISSLEDMEILLADLPLDKISTSMTINATAAVLLALYVAVARKRGIPLAKLSGTVQNDILKEYIARGTYIFPPRPSMRLVTDIIEYCSQNLPQWNSISISGYHIREAGSTAVQEVAFCLADGIAYVRAALERGLEIDSFAPRLSFFFNAQSEFFEEIAKFRAARRIWARQMREGFGARDPKSWVLRFHTQTAGSSLTAQQPDNNIVRTALQALSAVLGGTQSLHTNSLDEALALPTEHSAKIALRTQQIIAHETGVTNTVDPLAGSYYVEWLTDEIERQALDYMRRIDEIGGALRAIESGWIQAEIQEAAYRYQREVENGERIVVGMNAYQEEEPSVQGLLRVDPAIRAEQIRRLKALRERRDQAVSESALARLQRAAEGTENLMPSILACVEAWCTMGEICGVLRRIFGEYHERISV